ncbi:hypothetical protein [Streptomyces mirabilis]|uniref:hypothetical protein n=1 Tax=Streptomyces mirabilis TaxID=68239 RepID=UPI0033B47150
MRRAASRGRCAWARPGSSYLTGRELDDSGDSLTDGFTVHMAPQIGHLAERTRTRTAMVQLMPPSCAEAPACSEAEAPSGSRR